MSTAAFKYQAPIRFTAGISAATSAFSEQSHDMHMTLKLVLNKMRVIAFCIQIINAFCRIC